MQISYEIVAIVLAERHERAAHDNKLDLVDAMSELFELLETMLGLQVGVVAGAYGTHRRRLVARVRLRLVLEVRVGPARTVHAYVARHGDVRTSMRLAHHCHHCNLSITNIYIYIYICLAFSVYYICGFITPDAV